MLTLEEKKARQLDNTRRWFQTERGRKRRYELRKAYYERTKYLSRGLRRRWTDEEYELLMSWDGTDEELAHLLGRSVHAIQGKRHKIKVGRTEMI